MTDTASSSPDPACLIPTPISPDLLPLVTAATAAAPHVRRSQVGGCPRPASEGLENSDHRSELSSTGIKVLLFDVQGTATDFRGTIIREGAAINQRKGLTLDWGVLADEWRGRYRPALDAILGGQRSWCSVDLIYREALEEVLQQRGITVFSPAELDDLTRVWHRLEPWPDTIPGLLRLRQRYILATLSNADMAAVVQMARYSHLPWDVVLSGELAGSFKPDPRVYQMAVRYLGVAPGEILMVAAHKYDLRAAQGQGFHTAFIARPLEFGPDGGVDTAYEADFDFNAAGFIELAEQLGA